MELFGGNHILILLVLRITFLCKKVESQASVGCYVDDVLAPLYAASFTSNTTMTVTGCCNSCQKNNFAYCGVSNTIFCECSNSALITTSTCGDLCSADGSACGSLTNVAAISVYSSGGSVALNFVLTVTDAAPFMTISTSSYVSVSELFYISMNDGAPFFSHSGIPTGSPYALTVLYNKPLSPGDYTVTAIGASPGSSNSFVTSSSISVLAVPSIDLLSCPVISQPNLLYICNVSVTYQNSAHYYSLAFSDFPAVVTNLTIIGSSFETVGHLTPKGTTSDADKNGPASGSSILFVNDPITTNGQLIGIDYLPYQTDTFAFYLSQPNCGSLVFCIYLGICASTCPFDSTTNSFSCPGDSFCPLASTCCTIWPTASNPTWSDQLITAVTVTAVAGMQYVATTPTNVLPGFVLKVTGSLARSSTNSFPGDLVNGSPSNFSHYAMMTIKEFNNIAIQHACVTALQTATLSVTDTIVTTNVYTGAPPSTMCERIITSLQLDLNETKAVSYNTSLNLQNPYYVWTGYSFNIIATFPVAGPINFNLTYTPSNGALVSTSFLNDYPLATGPHTVLLPQSLLAPAVYIAEVVAYNDHNFYPDSITGVTVKAIMENITVIAQNPVSPAWTVVPNPSTTYQNSFLVPRDQPSFLFTDGNAWNFPTNSTITIDWGDGGVIEVDNFVDPGNAQPLIYHQYTKGNVYTITCNITNIVSGVYNVTATVTIYEQIKNFSVSLGYLPTSLAITYRPGFGRGVNQFPMDKNLTFFPAMTYGTVESYKVEFTTNGTIIDSYVVPNKFHPTALPFLHYFGFQCLLNMTVYAINIFESVSVDIYAEMSGLVRGLELDDYSVVSKPGALKTFEVTFESLGAATCLVIDFGDLSSYVTMGEQVTCQKNFSYADYTPVLLDMSMNITHIYTSTGVYNITALAYNALNQEMEMLMFLVTNLNCSPPILTIVGQCVDYISAPILYRGKSITVVAKGIINCAITQSTKKRWQIFSVDDTTGNLLQPVEVMNVIPSWNYSTLTIPAAFLDYGTYMVQYTMTMWDPAVLNVNLPFQKMAHHYIAVGATPLKTMMSASGVTQVVLGLNQSFYLQPAVYSVDPDFPSVKNFSIKWKCRAVGESWPSSPTALPTTIGPLGTGCFGNGPGYVDQSTPDWKIYGRNFLGSGTFEIWAEVTKTARTSPVMMIIKVVPGPVPVMVVKCSVDILCVPAQNGQGVIVNPNSRIGLVSTCVDACNAPMNYDWTANNLDNSLIPFGSSDTPTGTTGLEFALNTSFFEAQSNLQNFKLSMNAQNSDPSGPQTGSSAFFMTINQRPVNGNCSLDKYVGKTLIDTFVCTCSGWKDPENIGIDNYVVRIISQTDGSVATLMEQNDSPLPQQLMPLALPIGIYAIEVDITDLWGAVTVFMLPNVVTVNTLSEEEFNAASSSLLMSKLLGGGDTTMLIMIANARNSIINTAPWLDVNAPNLTDAERQDRMLQVNNMNSQTISAMQSSMTFETQGNTEAAAGVLADIMLKASESPNSALTMDLFTRNDVYGILDKMVDQIGKMPIGCPEDLRKLIKSVSTIAAGLVISVDEVSAPGCSNIPPKDYIVNADNVDYDTEVKSIDMTVPANPITAKKCNMRDLTISSASVNMPRLNSIMDRLSAYVMQKEVTGEVIDVSTKNNMTVVTGILPGPHGIAGTHYCGDSWVQFPEGLCPQGSCSLPVGLSLREWPCITYVSPTSAELLAAGTRTFDINIYDRNSSLLPVNNSPDIIKISIYRTIAKRGNISSLDPQFVQATVETEYQKIPIMYSIFNNNKTGSALTIEITPLTQPYDRLFVMVMRPRLPTLKSHEVFTLVQDISIFFNGTYSLFIDSTKVTGPASYYIGIGEFADNVTVADARLFGKFGNDSVDISWLKKPMSVDYNLRTFSSGCYFFDNGTTNWTDAGMTTVGSKPTAVRCDTYHLTSFGGGLFVMPNTIDFSYVFAHMGFSDNITIYLTIVLASSIFIIMLVWARHQDKKDIKQLGASPLPDNLANDKYLYEILVFTGNKKESQTDSTVQFVVSGDHGDTEIRTFGDSERKIFRKGEINVFVMAVPKSLGPLSYIRIWHDNSGKGPNASWFLSYMVFKDVQTGQKFEFICNDWFAVEKSDGQIERMIGVAGRDDMTNFGHLFSNNSNKKLTDGHLWFSIFMRPPRSRFTRCQRVGTCFSLLFLSMLVNAMWYNTVPSQPGSGFSLGPFNLSPAQIGIGVISNLIVFPPSFLIAYLFRKSRPRVLRKSRIESALEKASKKTLLAKKGEDFKNEDEINDDDSDEESKNDAPVQNEKLDKKRKKKIKKKKFTLPWWCTYVSWALVCLCVAVAVFFLLSYGIMFGNDKATKWLTALFISFFSSVLLVQPFKVILVAMFMSVVFKDVDIDEDDADEDELNPNLEKDQLWLYDGKKSQKLGYSQVHEDMLAELRRRRLNEIEMWEIIMELLGYMTFIMVLLVISYGERDPNGYRLKNNLLLSFINFGMIDGSDFSQIATTDDFWNYLPTGFMKPLRADFWYNGKPPYQLRGFLNDYNNRIMGYATIRQIRAKKNTCSISPVMSGISDECSGFSLLNEESRDYCAGWNVPNTLSRNSSDCQIPEFQYSTAAELKSLPLWGQRDYYGGGGYVIRLSGTTLDVLDRFTFLQKSHWIDALTRAVIVEFSTYNSQVNLFGICTLLAEYLPGATLTPSYRFEAVSLFPTQNEFGSFVIACDVVFCIYILYFTVRELRLFWKQKKAYFDSYWSYAEISIILVAYIAIMLYFLRDYETKKAVSIFASTFGNGYVRMTYAVTINEYYGYAISFLIFVGTLKFIKILRFNKRMGFLSATLKHCWDDLVGFMMAFLICFCSFVALFYFLIGTAIVDFCTFTAALATCFNMMMGKFQFNEMVNANPFAPVMFFVFVVCTSFVLMNLLITLIIKSFEEVKDDLLAQPNDHEIVDFVFSQFKKFLGQQGPNANPLPPLRPPPETEEEKSVANDDVKDLPSKVDRFLDYINEIYFDGTMDWRNKDALKGSLSKGRQILGGEEGVGVDRIGFGKIRDPLVTPRNFLNKED